MRGFWTIVRRELAAQWMLLVASALFGLFVAIMPWLAGSTRPAELRGAGGLVGVGLWGMVLAAALGAGAVGGPLAAGRLAFDYRLPVSSSAIWLGRLTAGALVVLACAALTVLVPLPFGVDLSGAAGALDVFVESTLPGTQQIDGLLLAAPLVLVLVFLLAHTVAVALAGARYWLALDLASVLLAKLGVWLAWRELGRWWAYEARWRLLVTTLVLAVVGLVVVAIVSSRVGRSEPDRAHRAQSLTLLPTGLLLALLALGYTYLFTHPGVDDLVNAERTELDDRWSLATGTASRRESRSFTFVVARDRDSVIRLGPTPPWLSSVRRAASSGSLVWLERDDPESSQFQVWTMDLAADRPSPQRTSLTLSRPPGHWAISPDGGELATLRSGVGHVLVERGELATGGLLGVIPIDACQWANGPLRYVDAGRIEAVCSSGDASDGAGGHHLFEIDLATRAVVDRGAVRLRHGWTRWQWSPEPVAPAISPDAGPPPLSPRD